MAYSQSPTSIPHKYKKFLITKNYFWVNDYTKNYSNTQSDFGGKTHKSDIQHLEVFVLSWHFICQARSCYQNKLIL
jgi:hypothetical protein